VSVELGLGGVSDDWYSFKSAYGGGSASYDEEAGFILATGGMNNSSAGLQFKYDMINSTVERVSLKLECSATGAYHAAASDVIFSLMDFGGASRGAYGQPTEGTKATGGILAA
jgi:hypothetical protein